MRITFLGATQTVTGSKYLITSYNKKILVDCGLFQGFKELRVTNWTKLPVDPSTIDAVILTHAHIDHTGYIPLLVKQGFKGKIYCSEATYDLCKILLPDSGFLQEEDTKRANRYGYTKHKPALPLYTKEDAEASLTYFQTIIFGKAVYLDEELHFTLSRSGHILGSAFVTLSDSQKTIVFSGDLGRQNDPIMKKPATLQYADYIVIESTYGNKLHGKTDPGEELGAIIRKTASRGGSVLIPAFAVGRAQDMLYYIHKLKQQHKLPDIPVFLDSPMATNATSLMKKHKNEHKLPLNLCNEICSTATYITTVEESKNLNQITVPIIIISASGMATGGRVLHHLKYMMVDTRNTILFAGFQAAGTRGDRIMRKEKEIKIHGNMYPLNAHVENLDNVSAHADYEEILSWLSNFKAKPNKIFITHGEVEASQSLANKIKQQLGWDTIIPTYLQSEEL